jgi:hypothetical protein
MIIVSEIIEAGGACPFQVSAKTDKGEEVYARYRWGQLRVEVEKEVVFVKQIGEDQDDEAILNEQRASGLDEKLVEQNAKIFKAMREFRGDGGPLSFDGYMDLEGLRKATEGVIQWPEE